MLTATVAEPHATIQFRALPSAFASLASGTPSASIPLNPGADTTIEVLVTAQDGSTKISSILVKRINFPPTLIAAGVGTQVLNLGGGALTLNLLSYFTDGIALP